MMFNGVFWQHLQEDMVFAFKNDVFLLFNQFWEYLTALKDPIPEDDPIDPIPINWH